MIKCLYKFKGKGNKDIMKMLESLVTVYILEHFYNLCNILILELRNLNKSQILMTTI